MAIPYKAVLKGNPSKPEEPKKYYAQVLTNGEIDIRELGKEIAEISTVSLPDVMGTIESLLMLISKYSKQNKIVRLGEVGSLRISSKSHASEKEEQVNAGKIKSSRFIFTPGKELQRVLKSLEFVKLPKGS